MRDKISIEKKEVSSAMLFRNNSLSMGGSNLCSEYENNFADEELIRDMYSTINY